PVHVLEPLLDRTELHAVALGLLAIDLPGALVGEMVTRLPVHRETGLLDHVLGLRSQHMAMDVDREPFAAGMHRPRKAAGDLRSFGQAGEQHASPPRGLGVVLDILSACDGSCEARNRAALAERIWDRHINQTQHIGGAMISRATETIRKWTETARSSGVPGMPAVLDMLEWAYGRAVEGVPGLDGAAALAASYTARCATTDEAVATLIAWQSGKAGVAGFVTGCG